VSPRGGGREKDEINGYIRLSRLRYPPRTLRVSEPRQLAGEGGREGGSSREGESDGGRERARQREREIESERIRNNAPKEQAAHSEMGCFDRRCRCCEALDLSYV
jgi:hypothetical protein